MRYDRRYDRVLGIITDDAIPRLPDGGVALCFDCQREIVFAGGFLEHLIRLVERLAKRERFAKGCTNSPIWGWAAGKVSRRLIRR